MKYSTEIRKIVIKVETDYAREQAEALRVLVEEILSSPSYSVMEKSITNNGTDHKEYIIYYNLIPIGAITTKTVQSEENRFGCMHILILKFDRLSTYDETTDNASIMCLFHCAILLNQKFIPFELTEMEICLDAVCEPNHTLGMRVKNGSIVNQANKYTKGIIEDISNQLFHYDIRRLKYKLSLNDFNHLNANIEVFKETIGLYDFFYYNYEEEVIKSDICLDMNFIESFVGALFYTTERTS